MYSKACNKDSAKARLRVVATGRQIYCVRSERAQGVRYPIEEEIKDITLYIDVNQKMASEAANGLGGHSQPQK